MVDTALRAAPSELGVVDGIGARVEQRAWPRLGPRAAWALACVAVDGTMLVLAALATSVGAYAGGFSAAPTPWTLAFAVLAVTLFQARGLYELRLQLRTIDDVRSIVGSTTLAAMSILSLRLLLGQTPNLAAESVRPSAFATG